MYIGCSVEGRPNVRDSDKKRVYLSRVKLGTANHRRTAPLGKISIIILQKLPKL